MKIYKFINAHWGRVALHERRLKVSRVLELNDPFDFMCFAPETKKQRHAFSKALKFMNTRIGIVSFSTSWEEPLLWSHYAEGHKGICLEFEVPEKDVAKIRYVKERTSIRIDLDSGLPAHKAKIDDMPKTKHENWSYEKEVRLLIKIPENAEDSLIMNFDDEKLNLQKVILGPRYKSTESNLNDVLAQEGIEIVTTRLGFKKYEVTKQRHEKMQDSI